MKKPLLTCQRKSFPSSVTPAFWLRPQVMPTTRESEGEGRTRGRVIPPPHMYTVDSGTNFRLPTDCIIHEHQRVNPFPLHAFQHLK